MWHNCEQDEYLQYRERIIFLGQAVDEELGNQLVGTILYLDSENHKDMRLYINTFGGDVSLPLIFCDSTDMLTLLMSSAGREKAPLRKILVCRALSHAT